MKKDESVKSENKLEVNFHEG
ncbi:MAG: hypothetical protein QG613_1582, partial [Pseudomonadota bacterium]|nr:hypothetical protein [Pseudomonadota bacterium]